MVQVLYRKTALTLPALTARIQSVRGSSVQKASIFSDHFVYHEIIGKNNIPKA